MPTVTPWAFGVVVFEITALCAILTALARMIFEAKLLRRGPSANCDAAISRGEVVLSVDCRGDESNRRQAHELLTKWGSNFLETQ